MESEYRYSCRLDVFYHYSFSVNTYERFTYNDFKNFIVIFIVIIQSVKGPQERTLDSCTSPRLCIQTLEN